MRVSILIPTRDRMRYLPEALATARSQRWDDLEILVSDDGSSDGTRSFMESQAALDGRVRLLTGNPVPGIFENVEYLIAASTGDAFTVLGDDDLLDPQFTPALAGQLVAYPDAVLAFCDHRVIDADGRLLRRTSSASSRRYGRSGLAAGPVPDPARFALDGGVWLGFTLFRRSAFPSPVFDVAAGTAADWDLAMRAAERGAFVYAGGPFTSYRDHSRSASRRHRLAASRAAVTVLASRRYLREDLEARRVDLLGDRSMRLAMHLAPTEPDQGRELLRAYRASGGRWTPQAVLTAVLLGVPRRAAHVAYGVLGGLVAWVRRARLRALG
jgi:glycosyltransferase involved in cell wall biosynthesis